MYMYFNRFPRFWLHWLKNSTFENNVDRYVIDRSVRLIDDRSNGTTDIMIGDRSIGEKWRMIERSIERWKSHRSNALMLSIHTTSNYATRAFHYIFETNVQSMTSHNRLTIYNTNHSTTTIFTDLFSRTVQLVTTHPLSKNKSGKN